MIGTTNLHFCLLLYGEQILTYQLGTQEGWTEPTLGPLVIQFYSTVVDARKTLSTCKYWKYS